MGLPIAITGAVMVCDKGTAMVPLVASGSACVQISGLFAAVIADVLPGVNISPFGMCVITKAACSPIPVGLWINPFANNCIIGNAQSLLEGATLPCAVGGTISVMSAAQATVMVGANQEKIVQATADYMARQMRQNAGGLLNLLRLDTFFGVPREPDQAIDIIRAITRFINNQRQGGKWDYKTKLSDVFDPISGTTLKSDIWGNVHFGYVGAGMGIPTSVLLAAGDADTLASDMENNVSKLVHRDFGGLRFPRVNDDPRDQAAIKLGAKLWRERGLETTGEDLLGNVRANAEKLK